MTSNKHKTNYLLHFQKYILGKRISILVINKNKNELLDSPDAREKVPIFFRDFGKAAGKRIADKSLTIRFKNKKNHPRTNGLLF